MDLGVFIPIGNNGWLISDASPQYMPTFDLNREVVQRAERLGFDFALSMVKLRGFGGRTEFWDHTLEPFTLMAGLAAVTERIKLYASVATLTLPPAIVARMAVTIDSIAPGRFGINIVSGWQAAEFRQMGLWPGDEHFSRRYDHSTEYVTIMRELWETGRSDLKGEYFQMDDCRLGPLPPQPIEVVCAGQSGRGMQFCAEVGDVQFILCPGVNDPTAHTEPNARLLEAAARTGRDIGSYVLFMVIADETDEAATAKWKAYNDGADVEALSWMVDQAAADVAADVNASARAISLPEGAVNFNIGTLVGSYERVAAMLDEAAAVPGTRGLMLAFDDPLEGVDAFGERIQPLMASRADRIAPVA